MKLSLAISGTAQNILRDFELRVFSSRDCEYAYDFYYNQVKDHLKEVQSLIEISNLEQIIHAYNIGLDMSAFIDDNTGGLKPQTTSGNFFWDIYENLGNPQTFTTKLYSKNKAQSAVDKGVGIKYDFDHQKILIQCLGLLEAEKLIRRKRDYFLKVDANQSNDKYQNLFKIFTFLTTVKKTNAGKVYLSASSDQVNELVAYIFKLEADSNIDIPRINLQWNAKATEIVLLFYTLANVRIGESNFQIVNLNIPQAVQKLFIDSEGQRFKFSTLERISNRVIQDGPKSNARLRMNDMIGTVLYPDKEPHL